MNHNLNFKQTINKISSIVSTNKAENNSYKLKNEIRSMVYSLYQHNKITKTLHDNLIKSL